ncbi:MAG: serine hydrolase domain-containing protein [Opitutaceae bacterium]
MKSFRAVGFLALMAIATARAAPSLPAAKPQDVGLSAERIKRVEQFVERLQAENRLAGAVTAVARGGKVVQLESRGFADVEAKRAMRIDDIFAIASMTKPIATVGVLMRLEEQRLLLSDPLEKFLPEFRGLRSPCHSPTHPTATNSCRPSAA